MRTAPEHVEGVERVVRAFGYWPSFHDAKLRGVHHDESGKGGVTLWRFLPRALGRRGGRRRDEPRGPRGQVASLLARL